MNTTITTHPLITKCEHSKCRRTEFQCTIYKCKCDKLYCVRHLKAHQPECTFDYVADNQSKLQDKLPQVSNQKIEKI